MIEELRGHGYELSPMKILDQLRVKVRELTHEVLEDDRGEHTNIRERTGHGSQRS